MSSNCVFKEAGLSFANFFASVSVLPFAACTRIRRAGLTSPSLAACGGVVPSGAPPHPGCGLRGLRPHPSSGSPRQEQGRTYTLQSENFFYFILLFLARAAPARFVISPSLPPANETRHVDEQVDEEGEGAKGAGRIVWPRPPGPVWL